MLSVGNTRRRKHAFKAKTSNKAARLRAPPAREVFFDWDSGAAAVSAFVDEVGASSSSSASTPNSADAEKQARLLTEDGARIALLSFLGLHVTDGTGAAEEYTVLFAKSVEEAMRIVGRAYPFHRRHAPLVLPRDARPALWTLHDYAAAAGAPVHYATPRGAPQVLHEAASLAARHGGGGGQARAPPKARGLAVMTGLSNVNGRKAMGDPATCEAVRAARQNGCDVLLDATSLLASEPIDLVHSEYRHLSALLFDFQSLCDATEPYHQGGAALVVRKEMLYRLRKQPLACGILPHDPDLPEAWESAELPDVSRLATLLDCVAGVQELMLDARAQHDALMSSLISQLSALRHSANGERVVRVVAPPRRRPYSSLTHAAAVSLLVYDERGNLVPSGDVAREAAEHRIHLEAGCFGSRGGVAELMRLDLAQWSPVAMGRIHLAGDVEGATAFVPRPPPRSPSEAAADDVVVVTPPSDDEGEAWDDEEGEAEDEGDDADEDEVAATQEELAHFAASHRDAALAEQQAEEQRAAAGSTSGQFLSAALEPPPMPGSPVGSEASWLEGRPGVTERQAEQGVVRVSLGPFTTLEDLTTLVRFLSRFQDRTWAR